MKTSKVNSFLDTLSSNNSMLLANVDFSQFTDDQLMEVMNELMKKYEDLSLEIKVFESYYVRSNFSNNPAHPPGNKGTTEEEKTVNTGSSISFSEDGANARSLTPHESASLGVDATQTSMGGGRGTTRPKKKKGEKVKQPSESVMLLTAEQKSEIATRELEELKDEVEKGKSEWAKVMDNLKAEMEELDLNLAEIKKDMFEFKRDIIQGALAERTGKVMAEKVLRYFEDKIRSKDTMLGKIRLKNSTLKTQKNKLMLQLKQKEEMGEVLHAIDFDQLKIENHQYLAKIEERNTQLLNLKMASGNIVQVMNVYKKKLNDITDESKRLQTEIHQRKELLEKLNADGEVVELEIKKALQVHHDIVKAGQEYRVPSVMEYVLLKARQQNLLQKYRAWKRKVEIAQMSLGR
ncbi:hypothetical protein HMI56_005588 [Coelomomyces lativittatus]|nr:hypothetical protein HMI56_005588 [Coelomomyces lativittatus]